MKYLVLRCEDAGPFGEQTAALLEGARTAHLAQLAQAGAAGLIRPGRGPADALDRFRLHRALLGFAPGATEPGAGRCYAEAADLPLEAGETAWCCELVSQRDGAIIDPSAGQIPTKESELLVRALDEALGSDLRRWRVGEGSHHLLLTRDPAFAAEGAPAVPAPERLVGRAWRKQLPKGLSGEALGALVNQAAELLESHPVNRVRVDLGENPANMVWLWGGSAGAPQPSFGERTGLSATILSNSFLLKGLAKAAGLRWKEAPASLKESAVKQLAKAACALLEAHDFVYLHVSVDTGDAVERTCAMERLDHILLKALTDRLPALGPWRLLAAVDDRRQGTVPLIAIGSGLPQQPVVSLSAEHLGASPLTFSGGTGLFAWFTRTSGEPEVAGAQVS
jgi:2,3-bisphosphoglycerate-independent phosphoglycerate mutase